MNIKELHLSFYLVPYSSENEIRERLGQSSDKPLIGRTLSRLPERIVSRLGRCDI